MRFIFISHKHTLERGWYQVRSHSQLNCVCGIRRYVGPVSIERRSLQVWNFHCKDKMVVRLSYLYSGNSYTGKTASVNQVGSQERSPAACQYQDQLVKDDSLQNICAVCALNRLTPEEVRLRKLKHLFLIATDLLANDDHFSSWWLVLEMSLLKGNGRQLGILSIFMSEDGQKYI